MKTLSTYLVENLVSIFEARSSTASKEEVLAYLHKINASEILDHLYDQCTTPDPQDGFKFMFKTRKDQANWLQVVESGITHNEFLKLIEKYGFQVEETNDEKTYIIYNDDIRIKVHETGWSKTKGNTDYLTDLKETATVMAIRSRYTSKSDTDTLKAEFEKWANKEYPQLMADDSVVVLISSYINSGIKAAVQFYNQFPSVNPTEYDYERREDKSKLIYKAAASLGGGKPDNWNPADMWLIKKDFDVKEFISQFDKNSTTLPMFNAAIKQQMDVLNLIPISLKLITGDNTGKCELMNPVSVEEMMNDYDVKIQEVTFGFSQGTQIVGSMHVFLNNDFVINVWDKSNKFTATYELRKAKSSGHAEGCVDKDYIITHYIYNDTNIIPETNRLSNGRGQREIDKYIDDRFSMAKSKGIDINLKKGAAIDKEELKSMYATDDKKVCGRFVMTILNLYYLIKNADKESINMMYLAGLKRAPHQCAYWKIH